MKRNATAIMPVRIKIPLAEVRELAFIFKADKSDYAPVLARREFVTKESIPIKEDLGNEGFVVKLRLEAEETAKFPADKVYMDTMMLLADGIVPETNIVCIEDIKETLFGQEMCDD